MRRSLEPLIAEWLALRPPHVESVVTRRFSRAACQHGQGPRGKKAASTAAINGAFTGAV
jgi:hypothetical protein